MQVIIDIKKQVDWYNKNYKVATIDQLLDLKSQLVTLNFYLAELVADNNEYQMQWDNEKKIKYASKKQKSIFRRDVGNILRNPILK